MRLPICTVVALTLCLLVSCSSTQTTKTVAKPAGCTEGDCLNGPGKMDIMPGVQYSGDFRNEP